MKISKINVTAKKGKWIDLGKSCSSRLKRKSTLTVSGSMVNESITVETWIKDKKNNSISYDIKLTNEEAMQLLNKLTKKLL